MTTYTDFLFICQQLPSWTAQVRETFDVVEISNHSNLKGLPWLFGTISGMKQAVIALMETMRKGWLGRMGSDCELEAVMYPQEPQLAHELHEDYSTDKSTGKSVHRI